MKKIVLFIFAVSILASLAFSLTKADNWRGANKNVSSATGVSALFAHTSFWVQNPSMVTVSVAYQKMDVIATANVFSLSAIDFYPLSWVKGETITLSAGSSITCNIIQYELTE